MGSQCLHLAGLTLCPARSSAAAAFACTNTLLSVSKQTQAHGLPADPLAPSAVRAFLPHFP